MKKFNWEKFAEGKIVVKFSSKEEIKDFCENAFMREFKFYNKRTKIKDVIDDWNRHNYMGLVAKNKLLIRTSKNENDGFVELVFWEYYMPKRKKEIKAEEMKGIYTLKDFEDRKIYIQCDKQWKAKELFKALDRRGWRWASGDRLKESNTHWEIYGDETYYCSAQDRDKQIRYGQTKEVIYEKEVVDFSKILF